MVAHTVYVVVFVSFGWFCFFAFCLLGMWYFLLKKKEKKENEADAVRRDEHTKVKEDVEKGPRGEEAITLSFEKDVHFEEDRVRNEEELREKNKQWKSGVDIEKGASASK